MLVQGVRTLFTERTPLAPRSPYLASKAAGDHLPLANHTTHGLDLIVTRCSNNYRPQQFPERLIPLMVAFTMEGRNFPVYGDGLNVRGWINVEDHCRGIVAAAERGLERGDYNFGSDAEQTGLALVKDLLRELGKSEDLLAFVVDRTGHDRRHAIDFSSADAELGWRPARPSRKGSRLQCGGTWTTRLGGRVCRVTRRSPSRGVDGVR